MGLAELFPLVRYSERMTQRAARYPIHTHTSCPAPGGRWRLAAWPLQLALAAVLVLGPAVWAPGPGWPGYAYADDGDGDGGADGGAGSSSADGGSAGSGGAPIDPLDLAPPVVAEQFVATELLALNPSPAALQRARALLGVEVIERAGLGSLGLQVVRLGLRGVDAQTAQDVLSERDPNVFALHHRYTLAQAAAASTTSGGAAPGGSPLAPLKASLGWPVQSASCGKGLVLGMIDTAVAPRVEPLQQARVQSRSWVPPGRSPLQDDHGTAVAALLVGQPGTAYEGLVPAARLLAAAPFYTLNSGNGSADVMGLVKSLDWLVQQGARVVGMSLAGPGNEVLDAALRRARERGVTVVAAAGNQGRAAAPVFPAAYEQVLAATALHSSKRVYRRANQGDYIDYALPGADVPTLTRDGQQAVSSGTSYAVPFLVALVAQSGAERLAQPGDWMSGGAIPSEDLGQPGKDAVYGHGLPTVAVRCPA